jgi:olefin beta-lactone synthetase
VFPDSLDRLRLAKADLKIVCVYGSTEAEPIAHVNADDIADVDIARMKDGQGLLVGHPVPDLKVRIVGDEIQVAGAHVNSGYLDPKHDSENKIHEGPTVWHRTGDAGYFDDSGRLWLLGRLGTQVKLSRQTVYPFSVEVAARGWQGVRRCALVETPTGACLVIEGPDSHRLTWSEQAKALGIPRVEAVSGLPMDRRHASKVDRAAVLKLLD